MADSDSRLGTVEDELKILKEEVRRTLVDLRALLMRADSPMNEASTGRRDALPEREPEPQQPKAEMSQVLQQESTATPPAAAPAQPPAGGPSQPPAGGPSQPPAGGPGQPPTGGPGQPPAGGPGQPPAGLSPLGVGPQQGTINTPVSAPPVIAPSGDQERAMAEQQQRMADQERRIADQNNQMAELSRMVQEGSQTAQQPSGPDPAQQKKVDEQQRQIADQTRQMAEMSRRMDEESRSSRDSRDSDGQNERKLDEQSRLISEQNRRMSDLDRKLDDQSKSSDVDNKGNDAERDRREADQIRENLDLRRQIEVADRPPREVVAEPETPRRAPLQREPEILEYQSDRSDQAPDLEEPTENTNVQYQDDGFDDVQIIEHPRRPEGRREAIVSRQRDQRVGGGDGVEGPRDKKRSPSRPERWPRV